MEFRRGEWMGSQFRDDGLLPGQCMEAAQPVTFTFEIHAMVRDQSGSDGGHPVRSKESRAMDRADEGTEQLTVGIRVPTPFLGELQAAERIMAGD